MNDLVKKIVTIVSAIAVFAFVALNIEDLLYLIFAVFFTPFLLWSVVRVLDYCDERKRRRLEFYKEYEAQREQETVKPPR